jgi:hypothetical protein
MKTTARRDLVLALPPWFTHPDATRAGRRPRGIGAAAARNFPLYFALNVLTDAPIC